MGAGITCMVIAAAPIGLGFHLYTPIDQFYAALGLIPGFLLWWVVVFLIRRKSEPFPLIFAFVVYVAMGVGPGLIISRGMFLANGALDPNELVDAKVEVVDKWVNTSGGR